MGSEDACAAVHQRIVYKSGSVHIDTVPVQHWAQSERRPSSETAVSAVAAGGAAASDGADADDVEVVAASASSTSTSHVSVSSSLLLTSFSCAVGRLSAMQKFVPSVAYTPAANLSMQVSMRLSFSVVAFFFARRIWRPCVNLL